jgi:membrane associated rhomboid family serine protease
MSTFIEEIKSEIKNKMFMKLIFINVSVFVFIQILNVIARLSGSEFTTFKTSLFSLNTNLSDFIFTPWGLFTSIFSHFSFFHLLFNMIFLYFIGKMAEYYLGAKSILVIYILGGIIGGIFELLAHQLFPNLSVFNSLIVGASGSIMAIFIALAIYKPSTEVSIYGLFNIKIIWLALIYFLSDIIKIGSLDGIAHLAHIGGAITGFMLLNRNGVMLNKVNNLFNFKTKPNLKVKQGGRPISDDDFNLMKKQNEAQTNKILDKISKSGYESLTKAEKEFLFKQSNNG